VLNGEYMWRKRVVQPHNIVKCRTVGACLNMSEKAKFDISDGTYRAVMQGNNPTVFAVAVAIAVLAAVLFTRSKGPDGNTLPMTRNELVSITVVSTLGFGTYCFYLYCQAPMSNNELAFVTVVPTLWFYLYLRPHTPLTINELSFIIVVPALWFYLNRQTSFSDSELAFIIVVLCLFRQTPLSDNESVLMIIVPALLVYLYRRPGAPLSVSEVILCGLVIGSLNYAAYLKHSERRDRLLSNQ
jgi:hypothetical protein